ncbi:MAG: hypothetical protein IJ083_10935 [Clostridia bacterium]|nr:hypothetical protein [Clostridia bacterium]
MITSLPFEDELQYGMYLKKLNSCLKQEVQKAFNDLDLTPVQGQFLIILDTQMGGRARLKDMEEAFQSAQSTIAGIAFRLERKRLIRYDIDDSDRRVKWVCITESGKALCARSHDTLLQAEQKMLSELTDREKKSVLKILQKMFHALDSQSD